jgi:hypothetical protein
MSGNTRSEARYLTQDELELVGRTHHPQLKEVPDDQLAELRRLVRETADRVRATASRHRHELQRRSLPAGARPAPEEPAARRKVSILAASIKRLGKEAQRREDKAARVKPARGAGQGAGTA